MDYAVKKKTLAGTLKLPSSKSQTLRALLFAFFSHGTCKVESPLSSPDTDSMVHALKALGAEIEQKEGYYLVHGKGGDIKSAAPLIDTGGSGIVYRFITALLSLSEGKIAMTDPSGGVRNRLITPLLSALEHAGHSVNFLKEKNKAPYLVSGKAKKAHYIADGSDSQTISALLILACFRKEPVTIDVINPGEIPWIQVTLSWLKKIGAKVSHSPDFSHFKVFCKKSPEPFSYTVPADYSSLMYPLGMALVSGSTLTIEGVDLSDSQGDKVILDKLKEMRAPIYIDEASKRIRVEKGSNLKGITIDMSACIDAISFFAVLGCYIDEGLMRLTNASIARKKECDRISAICEELKKMGAKLEECEDGIIIYPSKLHPAELNCYGDHRMVLALSVAAFGISSKASIIKDTGCIEKTYKSFVRDMNSLGAGIKVI